MANHTVYAKHYSDKGFWSLVRRFQGKIPFLRDALGLFYCLKDPATPAWVRLAIIGGLGYLILPLDIVPDFFPLVGWLDDAAVIASVIAAIRSRIKDRHWQQADDWLQERR
jgi:uncharacterized membrane protein YkvA (DUF1232 family)